MHQMHLHHTALTQKDTLIASVCEYLHRAEETGNSSVFVQTERHWEDRKGGFTSQYCNTYCLYLTGLRAVLVLIVLEFSYV